MWPSMPKLPRITSLLFPCNILRKKWAMKLIFYMQISMKVSYKLILSFFMGMIKHYQSSQNNSFQCLCSISKKKLKIKLIFCVQINIKVPKSWFQHLGHQSFLQVDASVIDGHDQVLKITNLQYLCNLSKKTLWLEFIFCMQINIKVSTSWHYDFWWKWPGMSEVPKSLYFTEIFYWVSVMFIVTCLCINSKTR